MEKDIKNNREFFEQEPSMEHMDKFLFKLQEEKGQSSTSLLPEKKQWLLAIAASIIILIGMTWFIQDQALNNIQTPPQDLSFKLYEIKAYYTQNSDKKWADINECSQSSERNKKILKNTENQLLKLDYNTEKIALQLKDANGNKKLELAYIQSLKAKNDLVNTMYNQICSPQQNQLLTQ